MRHDVLQNTLTHRSIWIRNRNKNIFDWIFLWSVHAIARVESLYMRTQLNVQRVYLKHQYICNRIYSINFLIIFTLSTLDCRLSQLAYIRANSSLFSEEQRNFFLLQGLCLLILQSFFLFDFYFSSYSVSANIDRNWAKLITRKWSFFENEFEFQIKIAFPTISKTATSVFVRARVCFVAQIALCVVTKFLFLRPWECENRRGNHFLDEVFLFYRFSVRSVCLSVFHCAVWRKEEHFHQFFVLKKR